MSAFMRLFSILIGLACTLVLLGLMILTRLLSPQPEETDDIELRVVELVDWQEPPPPPPEPETEPEEQVPPPPMAMVPNLLPTDDPDTPTLATTDQPVPMELGVEEFSLETQVAALPTRTPPKPKAAPAPTRTKPAPSRPAPPKKSSYSIGELDGKPRVISVPSVRFPRSLPRKGVTEGTVMVEVSISPSGRSSLRRIVSASHPELRDAATRIANGARFTPPKKNGQAVTAVMRWPLKIR